MIDNTAPPHSRVIIGIAIAISIAIFALIVGTLSRGFNFFDEAFVYSMLASARSAPGEFWGFQYILHPAYELLGESVFAFRVVRLIGYVAVGAALTVVAHRILGRVGVTLSRSGWLLVAAVGQIGTMAAWGYPPRYFGYNELSALLAQLTGAVLLLILAHALTVTSKKRWRAGLALWVSLGLLMVLLAFAKITAIVVMSALVIAVLCVARQPLSLPARLGALIGGALGALLALVVSGVPVVTYIENMLTILIDPSLRDEGGYSVPTLLIDYASSLVLTSRILVVPAILVVIVLFAVGHGLSGRGYPSGSGDHVNGHARGAALVLSVLLLGVLLLPSETTVWDGLGVDIALILLVSVVAILALGRGVFQFPSRSGSRAVVTVGALVFILTPFANAVGTNNPIMGQTVFSATLWCVGAGVALTLLWEKSKAAGALQLIPPAIALALIGNAAMWVVTDVFVHPYATDPYFTQTSMVEFEELRGMSVAADDAALIRWLQETVVEEDAHDTPTTVIANSGALFAFNNSPWATAWMGENSASSLTRSCKLAPPKTLFLLQPGSQVHGSPHYEAVVTGLANCGIEFPDDFEKVASHADPDPDHQMTLWRFER